jgi:hypothetical protein
MGVLSEKFGIRVWVAITLYGSREVEVSGQLIDKVRIIWSSVVAYARDRRRCAQIRRDLESLGPHERRRMFNEYDLTPEDFENALRIPFASEDMSSWASIRNNSIASTVRVAELCGGLASCAMPRRAAVGTYWPVDLCETIRTTARTGYTSLSCLPDRHTDRRQRRQFRTRLRRESEQTFAPTG